ncbi:class I adenylate-forming enzyme family protein [Streptomyces sp. H27-D2]|uniref:class I adenylate-forming enzyme family protein n=1 Tax=Streptomyces sp. H27-D2 TaxID=3046304 RepID=UPI002DB78984|nr:class I adenylate-forming enzyme family protein [Streptomyces sp. H27-D2]MEC4015036.1 class I adenylate-forming enzyme family protein [Streptomyces sp. H27-D2]
METPQSADLLFAQLTAVGRVATRPWATDHESAAVVVKGGTVEPSEIAAAAKRFAYTAAAEGISAESWCVVRLDNPLDILVAVSGLTAIGAIPVLISPGLDAQTARAALEDVPYPMHLLISEARAGDFPDGLSSNAATLVWEDAVSRPSAKVAEPLPPNGVERAPDRPYLATHTSGTTGVPKFVIHTRASFYQQSSVQTRMLRPMFLRGYLAAAISPVHVRTLSGILSALRLRLSLLLCASEDPDSIGGLLERWRPEYLETHPNTYVTWEDLAASGAMASVRIFLGTFDAMHPRTVDRMLAGSRRRLPVFTEVYAQSELGPISCRVRMRGMARGRRGVDAELAGHRVGWAIPGYDRVRVVDESGRKLPQGGQGRIQVRSKGMFAGYLNFPERTEHLSAGDWWDSGDWGSLGRSGALRLLDRQVERLDGAPSGIALEDVLMSRIPELSEVVVLETDGRLLPVIASRGAVPITDERWAAATHDMPSLEPPRSVAWDDIPRTATGKVRREILRGRLTG